jgi:hypothetical protein
VKQIIRELKRQAAGDTLEPEQLKGLIRAGYVYRNDDEHLLTDQGRQALAQPGVHPGHIRERANGRLTPLPLPAPQSRTSCTRARNLIPAKPLLSVCHQIQLVQIADDP